MPKQKKTKPPFAVGDRVTIAGIIDEELYGEDHTLVEYQPEQR